MTTTTRDITHAHLVLLGAQYATGSHGLDCRPVLTEPRKLGLIHHGELPDIIGWRRRRSDVIECKRSLSDRRADDEKGHRQPGAWSMGSYRWLLVPTWLDVPTPNGWGRLETDGSTVWQTGDPDVNEKRDRDGEIELLAAALVKGNAFFGGENITKMPERVDPLLARILEVVKSNGGEMNVERVRKELNGKSTRGEIVRAARELIQKRSGMDVIVVR